MLTVKVIQVGKLLVVADEHEWCMPVVLGELLKEQSYLNQGLDDGG